MTNSDQYENLIAAYLNGSLSVQEKNELFQWLDSSNENKKLFVNIKDTWDSSNPISVQSDSQLLEFYKKQAGKGRGISLRISISAAAAILIIGLLIGNLWPSIQKADALVYNTVSVPLGSKSQIELSDGTLVEMNSGSTLTYPNKFAKDARNVSLVGEAFFKVKSNQSKPFIIATNNFDVLVTGTEFNVCNYIEDNSVSVTLVEGVIDLKFKNQTKETRIKPGEKFAFNKAENRAVIFAANLESETAWKSGEFVFKDIAFGELVVKLERWYNVKITYSDERFDSFNYTGKFKNQETIWQVLDAMKLTSPISYKREGFREFKLDYKPI